VTLAATKHYHKNTKDAKKNFCELCASYIKSEFNSLCLYNAQDNCGKMIERLFNYFATIILQKIYWRIFASRGIKKFRGHARPAKPLGGPGIVFFRITIIQPVAAAHFPAR
jgi:hypothetical protein